MPLIDNDLSKGIKKLLRIIGLQWLSFWPTSNLDLPPAAGNGKWKWIME